MTKLSQQAFEKAEALLTIEGANYIVGKIIRVVDDKLVFVCQPWLELVRENYRYDYTTHLCDFTVLQEAVESRWDEEKRIFILAQKDATKLGL